MRPSRCSEAELAVLRNLGVPATLDSLGLPWKADRFFQPRKSGATSRLHVILGSQTVEIVHTGPKWFVPATRQGGGGAVDLTMHLLDISFRDAVARLRETGTAVSPAATAACSSVPPAPLAAALRQP